MLDGERWSGAVASIGVGRRDMSRAGGQCHYGNAATVDGADGGPVDVSSTGDAPPSGACVRTGRTDAICKCSGKNDRGSIFDFSTNFVLHSKSFQLQSSR